jgi:ABC-type glycerol-3-phosphate transport system permease component
VSRLHPVDPYWALILPYTAGGLPLSIFLSRARSPAARIPFRLSVPLRAATAS